jgi:integrase/recombinase XerC
MLRAMSEELVLQTSWVNPGQRKVEAVKACVERDVEKLLLLLNAYLSTRGRKRARTSRHTRATYELGTRVWLDFCWPDPAASPVVPLLQASPDDLDRFIATLQVSKSKRTGKLLTPSTISTYVNAVRSFYRALDWAGAIKSNPAEKVMPPTDPTPAHEKRPAVDLESYKALCKHLSGTDELSLRDLVMLRLFGDAGLRVSEVAALNVEDISLEHGTLEIKSGKGGKAATQFLTGSLSRALGKWLSLRQVLVRADEPSLLVNLGEKTSKAYLGRRMSERSIRRIIDGYFRELALPLRYRGTHTLRHTAGTRYYRATKDLHQTREFMRHANIATTVIYAKMDKEMLKKGVEALDAEDLPT